MGTGPVPGAHLASVLVGGSFRQGVHVHVADPDVPVRSVAPVVTLVEWTGLTGLAAGPIEGAPVRSYPRQASATVSPRGLPVPVTRRCRTMDTSVAKAVTASPVMFRR
jgi:hypothetical protein